jgi:hypothetical protein
MERTKEEYQQIYDDLLVLKETLNRLHDIGGLWPTPMNGKTWEEEKDEFWNTRTNAFNGLVTSGQVKSCEIKTLCEMEANECQIRKNKTGIWNHIGICTYHSSEYYFFDEPYSLEEMIEITKKAINDPASAIQKRIANRVLDHIGTAACEPRAFIEQEERDPIADNRAQKKTCVHL